MTSKGTVRAHQTAAGWLLRGVVRLLQPGRTTWGDAMQAEFVALQPGRHQWGFVLGCARAVLSLRAGIAAAAWLLLRAAVVIGMFTLAALIPVAALRLAAMLALAFLLAAYGLLHSSAGFGPTARSRRVRIVAAGGLVVLAVEPVLGINDLRLTPPGGRADTTHAVTLLVLLTVIVVAYLTALLRLTAHRSDVSAATVVTGATSAAAAAAAWLTVVVLRPSSGTWNGPALTAIVAAGLVAATVTAHRTAAGSSSPARTDPGLIAGLVAGVGAALLVGTLIDLLPLTGVFVSTSAPPDHSAHAPAHLVDSVAVWLIGLIAAVVLVVAIRLRSRTGAAVEKVAGA